MSFSFSSSVSTSKFYIPVNAKEFIENIASRPLHQALDIQDSDYHDEIKRLELDMKGIADKAHAAWKAHNTPKKSESIKDTLKSISELPSSKFYPKLIFLTATLTGTIGTAYMATINKNGPHRAALALGAIVLGWLTANVLTSFLPETPTEKLPDLQLQVTNIKAWIQLKTPEIEKKYKAEDVKINQWELSAFSQPDNVKILANRDQLLLVKSYFHELSSRHYS